MANEQNLAAPWKPGQSGNPGGKTSEQRQRELRNAEMATRLQEYLLEREITAIEEPASLEASKIVKEALAEVLSPAQLGAVLSTLNVALTKERLKLIRDAQERGFGAPKQETELTGNVHIFETTFGAKKPADGG